MKVSQEQLDEIQDQWLRELEKLGPETVRIHLANPDSGQGPGSVVRIVQAAKTPEGMYARRHPDRAFVESWLAGKDRDAARKASRDRKALWIGSLAAFVAAIASVVALFR